MGTVSYVGTPPFRIEPPRKGQATTTKFGVLVVLELPTSPVGPDEIPPTPIRVEMMLDPQLALDLGTQMAGVAPMAQRWMDDAARKS